MDEIKSVLDCTLKKLGLKNRILEYRVMELWEDVVGENITKHAAVDELHRGVLFIHVDHPVWIQQLSFAALDIKNRLNKAVGAKVVKEIRFKAGNTFKKQKTYQDMEEPPEVILPFEEINNIELMVNDISDPEVRKRTMSFIKQGKTVNLRKIKKGWKPCPQCGILISPEEKSCFHCELKQKKRLRSKVRSFLWEHPWLNYAEVRVHITELEQEFYHHVRREMIQELWGKIRNAAKNAKYLTIPSAHIQTYVMMRTNLSPEKITNKIIWQTLGDNIANKLLGG